MRRTVSPEIGRRIADRRKQLEWTLEMLASATGMTVMRVYRVEHGKVHVLADEVNVLSAVLGLSADYILHGSGAVVSTRPVAG